MIINSLNLKHFGKFNEKSLELKEGINIVYGVNEAGKSTIHTFIRGMLFGIEKQRGRRSYDNYTKYCPIATPTLYSGEMEFTIDNEEYIVKRNFYKEEKSCQVIHKRTARPVDLTRLKGTSIIKGVTENNYCNTIYIAQRQVVPGKDLANRIRDYITNVTMTRSSEVNITNALAELQKRKKEIESKQTKQQLLQLNEELQKIQTTDFMLKELEKQIEGLENAKIALHNEKKGCKIEKSLLDKIEVLHSYVEEYNLIQEKYHSRNECLAYKKQLQGQIEALGKMSETKSITDTRKRRKTNTVLRITCITASLCLVIGMLYSKQSYHAMLFVVFLTILAGVFAYGRIEKKKRVSLDEHKESVSESLEGMERQYQTMIRDLTQREEALENDILQYAGKVTDIKEVSEKSMLQLQDIIKGLAKQIGNQRQEIRKRQVRELEIGKELERLHIKEEKFRWEYAKLEETISDFAEKRAFRDELQERERKERKELEAIVLSMETIQQLASVIHDDFGDKFNHILSDYASQIIGKQKMTIKTDEKLSMKVVEDTDYIDLEYLSIGTIEQIYLALRVAASEMLLGDASMPIILDDAFAYYDDHRLKQTCKWLASISNRQIIVLTCQTREREMLNQLEIPYQYIEL